MSSTLSLPGAGASVGLGLSPASGKAVSELVLLGECRFADLTALRLGRFADTPADWRARQGWTADPEPASAAAP
jgi:sarcosine oxidase subunit beta